MNIILLQNIEKVGSKFEVITVKNGFARNYLIPKGLAIIANDTNSRRLADLRKREAAKDAKSLEHFQAIVDKLKGKVLKIGAKAGTSGKIFGSVTNIQLAQALKEQLKVEIDRRLISIPEEVKVLGSYTAVLDLHPDIDASVNFEVVGE